MFRKMISLLLVMLCVAGAGGCAANPEEDEVINKNEGHFENALADSHPAPATEGQYAYKDTFDILNTDISVKASVEDINVAGSYPVYRVRQREIRPEEVKHWAEVLFNGEPAYEFSTAKTKKEIEQEMIDLKQKVSDKEYLEDYYGGDEALIDHVVESYNQKIKSYEEQYAAAPETVEPVMADWVYKPMTVYEEPYTDDNIDEEEKAYWESLEHTQMIKVTAQMNGHTAIINSANRDEDDYKLHNLWFFYENEKEVLSDPDIKSNPEIYDMDMSAQEAADAAQKILKDLSLDDWAVAKVSMAQSGTDEQDKCNICRVACIRNYEDMPSLLIQGYGEDKDGYSPISDTESLSIEFQNGLLCLVEWKSPVEITETENDHVQIKPFDEITALFEKQMQNELSYERLTGYGEEELAALYNGTVPGVEIDVNQCQCGLARVKIKGEEEEFYLTPAWMFAGDVSVNGEITTKDMPLAVINAVDGSTIDINLGY